MTTAPPDFLSFSAMEEQILSSKLEAIRNIIAHTGEKGRSLEAEMVAWLRTFLPTEYGLSTRFWILPFL